MFVVIKKSKTSKRELVYIVESYRDENQKIRQRIIKKCGELSELTANDPDAIEKLREEAKQMTSEASSKEVELSINLSLSNSKSSPTVNYGFFFVESLYHSLKVEQFLERHFEDYATVKKISTTLKYFVIREFFVPLTNPNTNGVYPPLFTNPDFEPTPTLSTIGQIMDVQSDLQKHIYKVANKGHECYDRVSSFDITSYFFNSVKKGKSKKSSESAMDSMIFVQVGFLFDRYRNPQACVVFPDGTSTEDLMLEISKLKKKYNLDRVVITCDRGFGSSSTLSKLFESGNGYVVGRKVKGANREFQEAILDEQGYKWNDAGTFKFKSFKTERMIGNSLIPEKVIAMWTSHNAAKMKQMRDKNIVDFLSHPENYRMGTMPDTDRYVKVHDTSETPGETTIEQNFFSFDSESYKRDVALDGYYALATTEMDIPESVVIKRFHNMQKLGKAYAPPDPDMPGTPEELWTYDDVRAYFFISYLAMVMERKLERMLDYKYTGEQLRDAINNATCKNIGQDIYDLAKQPEVFKDIEKAFGVSFDKSYATLEMLRKFRKEVINAL